MPPKVKLYKDLPELNNDVCYMDWRKDAKIWKAVNKSADKTQLHN